MEFLGSVITIAVGLWVGQMLIDWWNRNRRQRMFDRFVLMLVLASLLSVACFFGAYTIGYDKGYSAKEAELKECAEEVSNGCPNVTTYAIMLEKENARLNKLCKIKPQKATD